MKNIEYLKKKIGQILCKGEEIYIYDDNQKERSHILGNNYVTDINKIYYYVNAITKDNLIMAVWCYNDKNKLRLYIYLKDKVMYEESETK